MYRSDFLDNLWRWKCGMPEREPSVGRVPDLPVLERSQWSERFERLMRNRLIMGAFRYGLMDEQRTGFNYDNLPSMRRRLELYERTGNTEHLVDVANLAMVEFEVGRHPKKHFSTGDGQEHVKPKGTSG